MAGTVTRPAILNAIAGGTLYEGRFCNLSSNAALNTALKTTVVAANGVTRPFGVISNGSRPSSGFAAGEHVAAKYGVEEVELECDGSSGAIAAGNLLWSDSVGRGVVSAEAVDNTLAASAIALEPCTTQGGRIRVALLASPGATIDQPAAVTASATGTTAITAGNLASGRLVVLVPNTGAATITLPAVADIPIGSEILFKKTTSNVAVITVTPNGTETISGHATVVNMTNENDWLSIRASRDADQEWEVLGASPYKVTTAATGNTTLVASQFVGGYGTVLVPNTAALSVFLPASASTKLGAQIFFQKTTADAEIITLDGNSTETIDGATTDTEMDANSDWTLLAHVAGASNWVTVAKSIA